MPDFPTQRGRRTQAAIDAAARTVVVRNGILATTVADITAEAGRSAASFTTTTTPKRRWSGSGRCASATTPTSGHCR